MGELSERDKALIVRTPGTPSLGATGFKCSWATLQALLDAARTEGRGDQEPVAWVDPAKLAAWLAPGTGFTKLQEPAMFVELKRYGHGGLSPLYAYPIREPEISRAAVLRLIGDAFRDGGGCVEGPDWSWDVVGFKAEANKLADAILNLAPVGGRGEEGSSRSQPCADGALPVLTETQQANLAGFAAQVLEALWENYDLDGGDIEDLGQRFGLIRQVPFDPERHTDVHGVGAEAGDDWFIQEPWLTRWSEAAREGTRVAAQVEREGSRDEQNPSLNEESQTNGS